MTKQTNRKPGATAAASASAPDAYTRITNRIVADLEQGVRPWCKPWGSDQLGGASPDRGGPTVRNACKVRITLLTFLSSRSRLVRRAWVVRAPGHR
jgi:antirestriction protein ArdC